MNINQIIVELQSNKYYNNSISKILKNYNVTNKQLIEDIKQDILYFLFKYNSEETIINFYLKSIKDLAGICLNILYKNILSHPTNLLKDGTRSKMLSRLEKYNFLNDLNDSVVLEEEIEIIEEENTNYKFDEILDKIKSTEILEEIKNFQNINNKVKFGKKKFNELIRKIKNEIK